MQSLLPENLDSFLFTTLELMAALFILAMGIGVVVVAVLYVIDRSQTQQTIRRNYPVIGRFR